MADKGRDPSELTKELLYREFEHLKVLMDREIESLRRETASELKGFRAEIITRFQGMDLALQEVQKFPTDLDKATERMNEIVRAEVRAIELRFTERDLRFNIQCEASKELLNVYRTTQEKAVDKAEGAVGKQIEGQDKVIGTIKERIDKAEGRAEGALKLWGGIILIIMAVAAVITVLFENGGA